MGNLPVNYNLLATVRFNQILHSITTSQTQQRCLVTDPEPVTMSSSLATTRSTAPPLAAVTQLLQASTVATRPQLPRHLRRARHWRVCSHQAAAALDQHSQGAEMAQSSRLPTRSLRSKANRLGGYDDVMGDATGNS